MVSTYQSGGGMYATLPEEEDIPVEEADAAPAAPPPAAEQVPVEEAAPIEPVYEQQPVSTLPAQSSPEAAPGAAPTPQAVIDAGGGLYQDYPDAPASPPTQYIAGADWQQAGPSPEQLQEAEATGVPIEGGTPRTPEAAQALNEVRPPDAEQEIVPVYGTDEDGAPMAPVQDPKDGNWLTRLTPFDEAKNQIVGEDGFNAGDLNPVNVVKGAVFGLGEGYDKARQRVVEAMGEEALDNIRKGRGETLPEEGLLDRVGGALLNIPETLNRLPVSKQSEDQIGDGGGYTTWLNDPANADLILEIGTTGYNGFTGGRALWEYYVSDKSLAQRGVLDVLNDPLAPITAGLGKLATLGKGASNAGRVTSGIAKGAAIALDPIGEGAGLAAKGVTKIPGVQTGLDNLADSKLNPFALTDDAKNRIQLDEAVTQGEALGRQMDELGNPTPTPRAPELGEDAAGNLTITDPATGTVRPFDMAFPETEFAAVDAALRQMPFGEYDRVLNQRTAGPGGYRWYDLLFDGRSIGLPQWYDNALTTNPVAHERYIDLMISRIDNAGARQQEVINSLYRDASNHSYGTGLFSAGRGGANPAMAARKADTIGRILDKGGFADGRATQHANLVTQLRARAAGTTYSPPVAPFPYSTPRPTSTMRAWDTDILFAPEDEAVLRRTLGGQELGAVVADAKREIADAVNLAQQRAAGTITLSGQRTLDGFMKRYGEEGMRLVRDPDQLAGLNAEGINGVAARRARFGLEIELGLRKPNGTLISPYKGRLGKALEAWDRGTGAVKGMMLFNLANILPYATRQITGNAATLGIANRRALLKYLSSPADWKAIGQRELSGRPGTEFTTSVDRLRNATGMGTSDRIRKSSRTGTLGAVDMADGERSRLSRIVSPETFRTLSNVSDIQMREALYEVTFQPGYQQLKRRIRQHAMDRANAMGVTVTRDQVDDAFDALEAAGLVNHGTPGYTAVQLKEALRNTSAMGPNVDDWADRVARDYLGARKGDPATGFDGLRAIDQAALKETDRVGLSFNETRLDAFMNRVTFYHYWNSRAGLLYARESLRNPTLTAAYYRAVEALNRDAEEGDYPDYLKGWLRFMQTPLGFSAYMDPATTFGTFATFAEDSFRDPQGDMRQMTGLGQAIDRSPFMVHPWIASTLYWAGMLGADANAPNPTGLASLNRQAVNLVNLWRTQNGMTPLDGAFNVSPNVMNAIAAKVSQWFADGNLDGGLAQRVDRTNPNASFENNRNWFVQQILKEQNPGWDEARIADEAGLIQDNYDNPVTREAAKRAAELPFQGPGTDNPGAAGLAAGIAFNAFRPFNVTTRPTMKDDNQAARREIAALKEEEGLSTEQAAARLGLSPEQTDALYNANQTATSAGPEDRLFEQKVDGYFRIGSERQKESDGIYDMIAGGNLGRPIQANGRTWTAADVAALPEDRRDDLARVYLAEQGRLEEWQAYKDARAAYKASTPELADYWAFEEAAKTYPLGIAEWERRMRDANPQYDAYVRSQENLKPELRTPGPDRTEMLLDQDGYRAANYLPTTLYDDPNMAPPGGQPPYIPGVVQGLTPSQSQALQAGAGEGGGDGRQYGSWQEKREADKASLQRDLDNYAGMFTMMAQHDAAMGYAPGTSTNRYWAQMVDGSKQKANYLDSGLKSAIEDTYGYFLPGSDSDLRDFLSWYVDPEANPTGSQSIDDFYAWKDLDDSRRTLEKPVAPSGEALTLDDLTGNRVRQVAADGSWSYGLRDDAAQPAPAAPQYRPATTTQPVTMLDAPGGGRSYGVAFPGLPLQDTGVQRFVGGQYWRLVIGPGGEQAWVPTMALAAAA